MLMASVRGSSEASFCAVDNVRHASTNRNFLEILIHVSILTCYDMVLRAAKEVLNARRSFHATSEYQRF